MPELLFKNCSGDEADLNALKKKEKQEKSNEKRQRDGFLSRYDFAHEGRDTINSEKTLNTKNI